MTDQPTVEEELTRKAGEALLWLSNEYERGAISHAPYMMALQMFDMICLGLVPNEYSDAARFERDKAHLGIPDLVLLRKDDRLVRVQLRRAMGDIKVTQIDPGAEAHHKLLEFESQLDPIKAASRRYPKVIQKLLDAGYRQVA